MQLSCNNGEAKLIDHSAEHTLRQAGMRITDSSLQLMQIFLGADEVLLSHGDLYLRLKEYSVDINRVTLYRILEKFLSAKLLHRVIDEQRIARYGLFVNAERDGGRFFCTHCHRHLTLTRIPGETTDLLKRVTADCTAHGRRYEQIAIIVWGICEKCAPTQ
jgi:Fur family transcriptional regulator, ferric uptake regulator